MSDRSDLPDLPCNQFVELVTDYLDGTLDAELRARVDAHLEICSGCRSVLAQWREVIRLSGRLAETDIDEAAPDVRANLMSAFRHRHGDERTP
jgi:anti-sigma factor RsiW